MRLKHIPFPCTPDGNTTYHFLRKQRKPKETNYTDYQIFAKQPIFLLLSNKRICSVN